MLRLRLRWVVVAALPWIGAACGDDGGPAGSGSESDSSTSAGEGCTGVACGGNGTCYLDPDDGGPVCVCNDGFENDGPLNCVPDGGTSTTATTTGTTSSGPTTDTTASTSTMGATDESGSTDTGDTTGVTTGMGCQDPGPEPNEDEGDAVDLGDVACDARPAMDGGLLAGDADVDWFSYHGVWTCGAGEPVPTMMVMANGSYRACMFAECDMATTVVMCQNGNPMDSPNGNPGCCADGGTVSFDLNCMGAIDESATISIRFDQGAADACLEYDFGYVF